VEVFQWKMGDNFAITTIRAKIDALIILSTFYYFNEHHMQCTEQTLSSETRKKVTHETH